MNDAPQILNRALGRLKTQNRGLSLRSLSQQVQMSPSYLSRILTGQRPLLMKQIPLLARALQLDHHEVSELQRIVLRAIEERELTEFHSLRSEGETTRLVTEYDLLGSKDLWLLEEWYLLPILNLVTVPGFVASAASIAARLGITLRQAEDSVQRLVEGSHLARGPKGQLRRCQLKIRFPTQRSHPSLLRFHKSMIQKALSQVTKLPNEKQFAERLISGVTFAANPRKVAEVKNILEDAMYRVAEILADNECSEVYQINLQMFSLTSP